METKDIVDLFITATGKIEFYWNFYTVTVLALIGWLVSTKNALALRIDLLAAAQQSQATLENSREVLSSRSFETQKQMVLPIHFFVGSIVLYTIWCGRLGESKSAIE